MTAPGSFDPVPPVYGVGPGGQPPSQPPSPPAGPGVQALFAAPPTEGDRRRIWIGLGLGGLALVLCCVFGVAGIVALGVTTAQAVDEQARTTVSRYLDAVKADKFDEAYQLLCEPRQREESEDEFAARVSREPPIASYTIRTIDFETGVHVDVEIDYQNGGEQTVVFSLSQDRSTGAFKVCGVG